MAALLDYTLWALAEAEESVSVEPHRTDSRRRSIRPEKPGVCSSRFSWTPREPVTDAGVQIVSLRGVLQRDSSYGERYRSAAVMEALTWLYQVFLIEGHWPLGEQVPGCQLCDGIACFSRSNCLELPGLVKPNAARVVQNFYRGSSRPRKPSNGCSSIGNLPNRICTCPNRACCYGFRR
jgi:hypothetical protein